MSYIHFSGRNAQSLTNNYKKWIIFMGAKCFPCMVFSNSVSDVDNCTPVLPKSRKSECIVGCSWEIFPTIKIYEDPTKQIQLHKQKYITYTINEILGAGHSSVIFTEIKP